MNQILKFWVNFNELRIVIFQDIGFSVLCLIKFMHTLGEFLKDVSFPVFRYFKTFKCNILPVAFNIGLKHYFLFVLSSKLVLDCICNFY